MSIDGVWTIEPGDVVVHPPHHLHSNRFSRRTRVFNLCIPEAQDSACEFTAYSVLRGADPDRILRAGPDIDALQDELRKTARASRQEPDDWVDAMARDLAADSSIRIADLARRYSITMEHAARRFRQRYFMTPTTFRSDRRFRQALDLLQSTQHSLGEIAQIAGYSDQPHFSRNCLQITGKSPGELRRRYF